MRYYSIISADGDSRLAVEPLDGTLVDVTSLQPELTELEDLAFASRVSRHIKSNTIVLAKDQTMVGMGAGQPNRA